MILLLMIAGLMVSGYAPPPRSPEVLRAAAEARKRAHRAFLASPESPASFRSGFGIDVRRYDIVLDIDPAARQIRGSVRVVADIVEPLTSVMLDMNST
ncbi:MAG: hypothetical protein MUE60_00510 [Candidatus Eisenbacteria bacterium]|jgi:hypothetical protein|nr:hypothetical protein [Candidatus Eisenbacteria bacterium]